MVPLKACICPGLESGSKPRPRPRTGSRGRIGARARHWVAPAQKKAGIGYVRIAVKARVHSKQGRDGYSIRVMIRVRVRGRERLATATAPSMTNVMATSSRT